MSQQLDQFGKEILLVANEATDPPSDIKSKRKMWEERMKELEEKNKHNIFSKSYVKTDVHNLSADEYGKPVKGSLTDIRGQQAGHWVDAEVDRLISEIKKIGQYDPDEGGIVTVRFEDLFNHYVDISNTVVGICLRAKKRKLIKFKPEMLYQHSCKDVKITVL